MCLLCNIYILIVLIPQIEIGTLLCKLDTKTAEIKYVGISLILSDLHQHQLILAVIKINEKIFLISTAIASC